MEYLHKVAKGPFPCRQKLLPWQERRLSFTATGYGKKIPTTRQVQVDGRWHRIYCTIFSNVGTLWVQKNGAQYIVDETTLQLSE